MKLLIIEDEKSNADRLCRLLNDMALSTTNGLNPEVIAVASSNAEAKQILLSEGFCADAILSDIQLGDGLSFEALSIAPPHIPVIFTTAYDEYAIKAFGYNGIAYLLKPIDREELCEALEKISVRDKQETDLHLSDTDQLQAILSSLQQGGVRYRERFLISFRDELKVVSVKDVSHIGLIDGKVFLYTRNGKTHTLNTTLEELEIQLDPAAFMRVTRQYIVNVEAVDSMVANFLGKMRLRIKGYENTSIIVSKAKVPAVKHWLDS